MRKILVVVVALASMNAFATRARVNALGNSPHLIDTQTVYGNPADMMMMGDFVTMESGTTATAASSDGTTAQGMVTRSMGDAKLGLSLGHQSKNASAWGDPKNPGLRGTSSITGIKSQQNPVELSYGMKTSDMAWGATLVYSNFNDKAAEEKESSAGIRAGVRMGAIDAKLAIGLVNTYEIKQAVPTVANKFAGTTGLSLGAGYLMDNMYLFGNVEMIGFKTESPDGTEKEKFSAQAISLGALSSQKKDGNEFFYGAALENVTAKDTAVKNEKNSMALPIWMGLEVDAASWLTIRGSIKQITLINSKKDETETPTGTTTNFNFAPNANSTEASIGAGLKFNKLTLDGALTGLTGKNANQKVDGTDLLGQVGVTYMF